MKLSSSLLVLTASSVVFSAPAAHHNHHEKRAMITVTEYVDENGAVVIPVGDKYVKQTSTLVAAVQNAQPTTQAAAAVPTTTTTPAKETTTLAQAAETQAASSSSTSSTSGFQDGTIKCSDFPSDQGAVSINWIGLNGWTSIMNMDGQTSTTCEDGMYCSYACAPGMSKTQWPADQPADGKSVGGLYCKDGYLYRSNTDYSSLCVAGVDTAIAVNQISQSIAMCRTDYPGSENMVIPTVVDAGSSQPISVVDEDTYYTWQGKKTSTQYYVNNAGVSMEDGCVWGTDGSAVGNWAPVVLGAGSTGGISYLSIIPNPNNKTPPNYNVKIVASEGSTVVGSCSYENGVYSGSGSDGCTVSVTSGTAQFVFY
ncbi:SUN family protein UTH1 NDAI_0B05240 [Naumovozyma dairenensis CBS 421]|uniref:SUN4 n=1 Tax=Naumovozyma dairenensis (strain ATCC 10597 / BCRC 20456 / CBS 421 / NBRC 0211 / NRRL Y-12639) TaxID=1071378 RepID=G0W6Z6_NAUDC|nr:hypothetical protein NDAI_0B05240 [Naumovozyma dairenensis CBS 421]CCD23557.1 hypothetical protein NDAI_0B05240 [Naumovozyma dairenensis CBS 421]